MQRSASSTMDWRAQATHLVVFQHGLWGNEKDFRNFHQLFQQYFPQDEIYSHVATSNATTLARLSQTYDGVDVGGTRLADEVMEVASHMPRLQKLSIAGHSLGGLYARYCIGVLYARGFFEEIEPMNFITLATPHMGTRRTQKSAPWNALYNVLAPALFNVTGNQFAMTDSASEETVRLSKSVRKYPNRKRNTVYEEMEGVLSVRVAPAPAGGAEGVRPGLEATAFRPMECKLDENGYLRVYEVPPTASDETSPSAATPESVSKLSPDPEETKTGEVERAEVIRSDVDGKDGEERTDSRETEHAEDDRERRNGAQATESQRAGGAEGSGNVKDAGQSGGSDEPRLNENGATEGKDPSEDTATSGGLGADAETKGEAPATATPAVCITELDLVAATVTVSLPEQDDKGRRRSFSRRKSSSSSSLHSESLFWEIEIVEDASTDESKHSVKTITVRIPYTELATQWKWVAALSNASHGVLCRSQTVSDKPLRPVAPPLLSCLTRGQFIQALQLFRVRVLYASIFNDLQVPYSCGSIRAFNPYRVETEPIDKSISPFYQHVVMRSLWNAPLLRDTLPEDVAARAERSSSLSRFSLAKTLGERTTSSNSSQSSHHSRHHHSLSMSFSKFVRGSSTESRSAREILEQPPSFYASQSISSMSSSSSSSFIHRRLDTIPQAPSNSAIGVRTAAEEKATSEAESSEPSFFSSHETKRPPPFEDGLLLLDLADHAFSHDALRDELRGMMISLQSVGWRRIDISFRSPLAHMKIIAMTANPTKPLSKGLDVVHHVMDTFLL